MPNTEGAMLPHRCRADTLIVPSLSDNIEITSNPYAPVVSVVAVSFAAAGGSGGFLNASRLCVVGWCKLIWHRL